MRRKCGESTRNISSSQTRLIQVQYLEQNQTIRTSGGIWSLCILVLRIFFKLNGHQLIIKVTIWHYYCTGLRNLSHSTSHIQRSGVGNWEHTHLYQCYINYFLPQVISLLLLLLLVFYLKVGNLLPSMRYHSQLRSLIC